MKIGIYDPYLDTLGGGEKYMLTIATYLSQAHDVSVFWDQETILRQAKIRFGLDTSHLKLTKNIFSSETSIFIRMLQTNKYDIIFFLSDGSIPWLFARRNFLLFQFPVNWVDGTVLTTKLKLGKFEKAICNSYFVKSFIDKSFHIKSEVLPPPVTLIPYKEKKENIILSIGRFTKGMNMKKQEELIEVFIHMCDKGLRGWKFILAGSVLPRDRNYVINLHRKAREYPIQIFDNLTWREITILYQKAKIYWHGAGYGENLQLHPERAEHFGISTAEAMSAGCVPIVFNAGGQKEIVENEENGFLWDTQTELIKKTKEVMKNKILWKKLSQNARKHARVFSQKRFCKSIMEII